MKQKFTVIFFGDSICFGQGISIYKGWIPRLAEKVDVFLGSKNISSLIINTSINGRTSRQALENMPYDVQSQSPDLLVLQFGMNDCNYWDSDNGLPRVSPNAFKENLKEIIQRAKKFGAKKVILNTNHPTLRNHSFFPKTELTYNQSNLYYNEIIREVSEDDEAVILNDIEVGFKINDITNENLNLYLLDDHLHLSEIGHNLYFELTLPILMSTIKNLIK